VLHSVLSPSRAIKTRLRLNHWSLLAVIVCACLLIFASTVVSEDQVAHTGVSSFQLFLTSAVAILAVATTMKLRKDPTREPPPRALVIAAAAFILLLVLAVVSLPLAKHWVSAQYGTPSAVVPVPLSYLVNPLITAGLSCLLAILAVNLVPPSQQFEILWWFAFAGAVTTPIGVWWNASNAELYGRWATRLAGAAVLHTALLLGLAICVAAVIVGHRRGLSALSSAAYVIWIMATGARTGVITLALFMALFILPSIIDMAKRRPNRLPLIVSSAVAGMTAFAAVAWHVMEQRGFKLTGAGRVETWVYGIEQALGSLTTLVFGVGYGVLWPWYAFETNSLPQAGAHGPKQMPEGITLSHAHNTYVAVFSEQGLVGLALLLVLAGVVCWAWWRARGVIERAIASGLVATLVGFAFDTYLTKNFPVSFIWWSALASLLVMMNHRRNREPEPLRLLEAASAGATTPARVLTLGHR
jgi:putative membrane protein